MRDENVGIIMGLFMMAFLVAVIATIGAVCWPYTINTWLAYVGKEPALVWWQGSLLGIVPVVGQFAIPLAIVTWILMMFL